jgi:hypothetical protein
MKIYIKNPIVSSSFIIILTFIISIVIFYLFKPKYILKISNNGVKKIDHSLLISYSLLYGVIVGIIYFLLVFKFKSNTSTDILIKNVKSYTYKKNDYSPI